MIDYVQGTNTSTLLESNVSSVDPNVSGELQLLSMVLSGGGQPTSFHVAERDSLSDGLLFAQECEQYRKRLFCKGDAHYPQQRRRRGCGSRDADACV